jgi:hypothetical protein
MRSIRSGIARATSRNAWQTASLTTFLFAFAQHPRPVIALDELKWFARRRHRKIPKTRMTGHNLNREDAEASPLRLSLDGSHLAKP